MKPNLFHRALSQVSDKTRERVREWCDKIDEMEKREIKFRQPIYDRNGFKEFHYWGFMGDRFDGPVSFLSYKHKELNDDAAHEQYTGLRDRNGVEIYEGDVLADELAGDQLFFKVVFEDGRFKGERLPGNYANGYLDPMSFHAYYRVGNIHEPKTVEANQHECKHERTAPTRTFGPMYCLDCNKEL